ncbi:nuclear transport factor 2 family protein [Methylobacterium iners]|uniref:nuclear transport factor 2 family protein n=1 Tax=Methylobacterium iners TaxID=418707 RepID=UPI001EE32EB2|nr:nuclear transport factor 2 family protein [Methylobacterium iners]
MMSAVELLHRHFETLVGNPLQWQSLVDDEVLWELPFAPALGHPARLTGRAEVVRHATWFVGAVENFRFFDLRVYPNADPDQAVAEVRAEGVIKETGRLYQQEYIVFLRSKGGRILSLREYFDPTRAAAALDVPLKL